MIRFLAAPPASAAPHRAGRALGFGVLLCAAAMSSVTPAVSKGASPRVKVAVQDPAGATPQSAGSQQKEARPPVLTRAEILASDPERLERIGRHVIVGFHTWDDIKVLVEKKAVGGIFITDHNAGRRSAAQIKAEIDALQAIRRSQGLPPLLVAADQEGGSVSRLSPPLRRQPSLAAALAKVAHDVERKPIVEDYARRQAGELTRIGVTLNFAPVVDLKLNLPNRNDGETRLRMRAISEDPYTVAKVAGWYCDTLAEFNIMCTLKHFPGLGRVTRDTHVSMAEVSASEGTLELNDWVPFRRVMSRPNAVTMLGHVKVGAIDGTTPASYSDPVIRSLIRQAWHYDGLIVTDDLSMGAIARSKSGIGVAALRSLNAGTDYVLVSYSEKDLDVALSTLIAADQSGALDGKVRSESRARIERLLAPRTGAEAREE